MGQRVRFFLNDLSIAGQFVSADAFVAELRRLLEARDRLELVREGLLCSRSLGDRPATPTQTFQSIVLAYRDKVLKQRVLHWLGKAGPFWEDDRAAADEDLFHFAGTDVTLQGLGEAARRRLLGANDAVYSLPGAGNGCDNNPLVVAQGLLEAKITDVEVPNHLSIESMQDAAIRALRKPKSWTEMLAAVGQAFDSVSLSDDIAEVLRPHPFSANVAERVMELVGILDRLAKSRDQRREFTEASHAIVANFFAGGRARFTDESTTNKREYREEMTFPDPDTPGERIFCPFHGKINQPAYRIHIRWPLEARHEKVAVLYIGPKITK